MKRDLISLQDYSADDILGIVNTAADLKRQKKDRLQILKGKSIGLIFQKPSNRTRVSFEVGIWMMGGNCIYLGPDEINLGKRESTSDVAQTLSRYLNGIVARTHSHDDIIELGQNATVPVINGLSDLYHPCQALADLLTMQERFTQLKGLTLAYVGDGNNVCHSLLLACAKAGVHMRVSAPNDYEPSKYVVDIAQSFASQSGSTIKITEDPKAAVKGANVIYADVWVSMGQETETADRLDLFQPYQINSDLVALADKDYIFLHCLPAHRGEEVTAGIIDGPHSVVFDQAENRMHVQKAVLQHIYQS